MKKIRITVDFSAEVPDSMGDGDIEDITLEIPFEKIVIFDAKGPVEGARMTEYMTSWVEDDELEEEREQRRRDEKNGLYGAHVDVAN